MWYPSSMMQVDRRDKYQQMHALLNEKQWRQYLALEAKERGSVAQVAQEAKVSQNTIRRGIREVEAGEGYTPGERQREKGGGRKKESEKDPTLLSDLEGLLEPKGDPMSLLKRHFVHTTDSHHPYPIYPNLVNGRTPEAPDVIWVADFTYIRLQSEFVYLATILDAYSRRCVGWNLSTRMDTN